MIFPILRIALFLVVFASTGVTQPVQKEDPCDTIRLLACDVFCERQLKKTCRADCVCADAENESVGTITDYDVSEAPKFTRGTDKGSSGKGSTGNRMAEDESSRTASDEWKDSSADEEARSNTTQEAGRNQSRPGRPHQSRKYGDGSAEEAPVDNDSRNGTENAASRLENLNRSVWSSSRSATTVATRSPKAAKSEGQPKSASSTVARIISSTAESGISKRFTFSSTRRPRGPETSATVKSSDHGVTTSTHHFTPSSTALSRNEKASTSSTASTENALEITGNSASSGRIKPSEVTEAHPRVETKGDMRVISSQVGTAPIQSPKTDSTSRTTAITAWTIKRDAPGSAVISSGIASANPSSSQGPVSGGDTFSQSKSWRFMQPQTSRVNVSTGNTKTAFTRVPTPAAIQVHSSPSQTHSTALLLSSDSNRASSITQSGSAASRRQTTPFAAADETSSALSSIGTSTEGRKAIEIVTTRTGMETGTRMVTLPGLANTRFQTKRQTVSDLAHSSIYRLSQSSEKARTGPATPIFVHSSESRISEQSQSPYKPVLETSRAASQKPVTLSQYHLVRIDGRPTAVNMATPESEKVVSELSLSQSSSSSLPATVMIPSDVSASTIHKRETTLGPTLPMTSAEILSSQTEHSTVTLSSQPSTYKRPVSSGATGITSSVISSSKSRKPTTAPTSGGERETSLSPSKATSRDIFSPASSPLSKSSKGETTATQDSQVADQVISLTPSEGTTSPETTQSQIMSSTIATGSTSAGVDTTARSTPPVSATSMTSTKRQTIASKTTQSQDSSRIQNHGVRTSDSPTALNMATTDQATTRVSLSQSSSSSLPAPVAIASAVPASTIHETETTLGSIQSVSSTKFEQTTSSRNSDLTTLDELGSTTTQSETSKVETAVTLTSSRHSTTAIPANPNSESNSASKPERGGSSSSSSTLAIDTEAYHILSASAGRTTELETENTKRGTTAMVTTSMTASSTEMLTDSIGQVPRVSDSKAHSITQTELNSTASAVSATREPRQASQSSPKAMVASRGLWSDAPAPATSAETKGKTMKTTTVKAIRVTTATTRLQRHHHTATAATPATVKPTAATTAAAAATTTTATAAQMPTSVKHESPTASLGEPSINRTNAGQGEDSTGTLKANATVVDGGRSSARTAGSSLNERIAELFKENQWLVALLGLVFAFVIGLVAFTTWSICLHPPPYEKLSFG